MFGSNKYERAKNKKTLESEGRPPPPQDYEDVGDNCKNIGKYLT